MLHTKEWYDLLQQFEKDRAGRMDREPKELWPHNVYQDGAINRDFQLYFKGYSFGKLTGRQQTEATQ